MFDHVLGAGIYTDEKKEVENGIVTGLANMKIFVKGSFNKLLAYSSNTRHVYDCMKLVLASDSTEQSNFVKQLWNSNLKFIAFDDGVYSFEKQSLLSYPVEGVFFTYKIKRRFPVGVDASIIAELMERVIKPILPDEEQRSYFLHCLARALAGEIYDKKWYICVGERNTGKGVLCELVSSAFEDFVQTINSENLVYCR